MTEDSFELTVEASADTRLGVSAMSLLCFCLEIVGIARTDLPDVSIGDEHCFKVITESGAETEAKAVCVRMTQEQLFFEVEEE